MKTIAILLAGGTGSRLGADIPKQFIKVNKKEIFQYSLETLQNHPMIDGIWVVTEEIYQEHFRPYDVLGYSLPGETRGKRRRGKGARGIRVHCNGFIHNAVHGARFP